LSDAIEELVHLHNQRRSFLIRRANTRQTPLFLDCARCSCAAAAVTAGVTSSADMQAVAAAAAAAAVAAIVVKNPTVVVKTWRGFEKMEGG
jgi:hypothetical protein